MRYIYFDGVNLPVPLIYRIERKYRLISALYLAGLFGLFILLRIWQNCVSVFRWLFNNHEAYHREFESHKCSILDISRSLVSKIHCTLLANQKRVRVQCIIIVIGIYAVVIGENSFFHIHCMITWDHIIVLTSLHLWFDPLFFRPNCPPSVGKLIKQCFAPEPKVGMLLLL